MATGKQNGCQKEDEEGFREGQAFPTYACLMDWFCDNRTYAYPSLHTSHRADGFDRRFGLVGRGTRSGAWQDLGDWLVDRTGKHRAPAFCSRGVLCAGDDR